MGDLTEFQLHKQAAEYFRTVLAPEVLWTHIPMQGTADARRGAILKSMGAQAGWPDFLILYAPKLPHYETLCALGIELKAARGRLSEDQSVFGHRLNKTGGRYEVCRSLKDVECALLQYGVPTRGRIAA